MRVRILKQTEGIIDGVSLSHLHPGVVYEVPISLGVWLIAQKVAEEELARDLAIDPLEDASAALTGGVTVIPPNDREDDRPPRRKPNRR